MIWQNLLQLFHCLLDEQDSSYLNDFQFDENDTEQWDLNNNSSMDKSQISNPA